MVKRVAKCVPAVSACIAVIGSVGVSQAQDTAHAPTLEEVVVTAQKRAQDLQDVAVAVSAYTSDMRDKMGINSVTDIANFTPGMQYSNTLDRVSIRGVGRLIDNLAIEGGVATYYDGVYTPSARDLGQSPLLIERIEVLRGPQGTLYGRNSLGGAMNVISKRPTDQFGGEVRLSQGSFDRRVVEGAVSGPFNDSLRYRVAAVKTNQEEGYFENVSGGPDEGGVTDAGYYELQVAGNMGERLDAWIKYSFSEATDYGRTTVLRGPYETVRVPATYTVPSPYWGFVQPGYTQQGTVTVNPAATDVWKINTNTPQRQRLRHNNTIATDLVWHFDSMDLRYVGGWRSYKYDTQADYDSSPMISYRFPGSNQMIYPRYETLNYTDNSWNSHEITLASTHEGPLQWIVGGYVYDEKNNQALHIPGPDQPEYENLVTYTGAPFDENSLAPTPQWPNPLRDIYTVQADLTVKSRAAFAQVDWEFAEQWKATAGLRYTRDHKAAFERTRQTCFAYDDDWCPFGVNPIDWTRDVTPPAARNSPLEDGVVNNAYRDQRTGFYFRNLDKEWDAFSGTAGLQWTPSADTNVYFTYSRGYKAGGFNAQSIQALPTIKPEFANAYELGVKLTLDTLRINAATFYYDYTDLQALIFIAPPSGGPGQNQLINLDKAESLGFELEAVWQPIDNLQVSLGYAYLNAEIKKACCMIDTNDPQGLDPDAKRVRVQNDAATFLESSWAQNLAGEKVPYSPENKINLNVNYALEFAPGTLLLSTTYHWRDETYYSLFNRSYNLAPSYDQLDLRATWTDKSNRYSVVGYVRNVMDDIGYDGVGGTRQSIDFTKAFINPAATIGNFNPSVSLTPPRTYGVQLQYRFGAN